MKIKQLLSITALLTLSLIPPLPSYSQPSNPCKAASLATPSNETREIRVEKYGIAFNIPDNYRTRSDITENSIQINIYNPSNFNYVGCLRKNNVPGVDDFYSVYVSINKATTYTSLKDIAIKSFFRGRGYSLDIMSKATFRDLSAVTFKYESGATGAKFDSLLFLTPSKKFSVLISSDSSFPDGNALAETIKSSFTFIN